ncbi:MAG: hypothetical protein HY961_20325 [Ignavibacteriae bacterium]|nr:hypothetical protein [Ignavibacteriota bacterium]
MINVAALLRYTALVLAALAMVMGAVIVAGYLVPKYFPQQYRVVIGAVVFLYGAFRFTVIFFRGRGLRNDNE